MNRRLEAFVKIAPPPVLRVLATVMLYPSLWYNLMTQRTDEGSGGVTLRRSWYSKIDDGVFLGALPYPKLLSKLDDDGVCAILNTVREWNGNLGEYQSRGWVHCWIPIIDFTPPTIEQLEHGVNFITDQVNAGRPVYVHCKAGKGRSASMVMGYLIRERGMTPKEAQVYLLERRPQILQVLYKRDVIKEFAAKYGRVDAEESSTF